MAKKKKGPDVKVSGRVGLGEEWWWLGRLNKSANRLTGGGTTASGPAAQVHT